MHDDHFEFLVMPFDLTDALSTFQDCMNQVFHSYLYHVVIVFFNNILVYNPPLEDHAHHLSLVLSSWLEHVFFVKVSKCSLTQ